MEFCDAVVELLSEFDNKFLSFIELGFESLHHSYEFFVARAKHFECFLARALGLDTAADVHYHPCVSWDIGYDLDAAAQRNHRVSRSFVGDGFERHD